MFDPEELVRRYAVADRGAWHLRVNFIASLDGAATHAGLSAGLNNADDKQVFDTLRMLSDVVLVGAGTLRAEGYGAMRLDGDAVAWRLAHGLPAHPVLAVVSSRLALEPDAPMFTDAPVRPLVLTHEASPAAARLALADGGGGARPRRGRGRRGQRRRRAAAGGAREQGGRGPGRPRAGRTGGHAGPAAGARAARRRGGGGGPRRVRPRGAARRR
ncbi:dihydrofolate reductase family protein [Georgenia sp. SUBG003]|uniref:dihydrofolate reductase family protein n=1 Tax=Georgenia sp. SUBG003 TaxID=1497974 RepID=UPI003AB52DCE